MSNKSVSIGKIVFISLLFLGSLITIMLFPFKQPLHLKLAFFGFVLIWERLIFRSYKDPVDNLSQVLLRLLGTVLCLLAFQLFGGGLKYCLLISGILFASAVFNLLYLSLLESTFLKYYSRLFLLFICSSFFIQMPIPAYVFYVSVLPFIGYKWFPKLETRKKFIVFAQLLGALIFALVGGLLGYVNDVSVETIAGVNANRIVESIYFFLLLFCSLGLLKALIHPIVSLFRFKLKIRYKLFLSYLLAGFIPLLLVTYTLLVCFYMISGVYFSQIFTTRLEEYAQTIINPPTRFEVQRYLAPTLRTGDYRSVSNILNYYFYETGQEASAFFYLQEPNQNLRLISATKSNLSDDFRLQQTTCSEGTYYLLQDKRIYIQKLIPFTVDQRTYLLQIIFPFKKFIEEEIEQKYALSTTFSREDKINLFFKEVYLSEDNDDDSANAENHSFNLKTQPSGSEIPLNTDEQSMEGLPLWKQPIYFSGIPMHVSQINNAIFAPQEERVYLIFYTSLSSILKTVIRPQNERGMLILGLTFLILLGTFIFSIFSIHIGFSILTKITSSLEILKRGTKKIREGDLNFRIALESKDELQDLSSSFNLMTEKLQDMVSTKAEKEAMQKELMLARDTQRNLLPQEMPEIPHLDLAGICIPAKEVGGDYFDFLQWPDDQHRLGIAIGDVSGKGMPAALLVSTIHATMRLLYRIYQLPSRIMQDLNNLVFENTNSERFATVFLAKLDVTKQTFAYASGGHNPPIWLKSDGSVEQLLEGGLPCGVMENFSYSTKEIQLSENDIIVLYSDGITEAVDVDGTNYGENRLLQACQTVRDKTAQEMMYYVLDQVTEFAKFDDFRDDMTLIIIKLLPKNQ